MVSTPQNQQLLRLSNITQIGFGAILAIVVGVGIVSKLSMSRLTYALDWLNHTYKVKTELKTIAKSLVDAETGQRGFIFTSKEDFLEPYYHSQTTLQDQFKTLELLTNETVEQRDNVKKLKELSEQKMEELALTIALKKAGKSQEVREIVLSGKGKLIMDQIDAHLQDMDAVENQLLAHRTAEVKSAERFSNLVTLGGTSLVILLGLFCVVFITNKVIRPIHQVAQSIATTAHEIASMTSQQERVAAQQAVSVHQTTSTMDELGVSSRAASEQAEIATKGAQQVAALAEIGTQAVEHTLEDMAILKEKVMAIANQILQLNTQTNQIGNISSLVSDLANQTNMLALNAAVEAVRAGDRGKGFAVVAAEIRKLADQSKQAAEKINTLVSGIQTSINSTVAVTHEGTQTVEQGMKTAQGTAETFDSVSTAMNQVVTSSQQMAFTVQQQAIAIQQVVEAMTSLNQGAAETASGITQAKIGTQKLNEAALDLQSVV